MKPETEQTTKTSTREKVLHPLRGGDILFIVPPFGSIHDVALGPHILQTIAEEQGYSTDIIYLNILLASELGIDVYNEIANAPLFWMLGERLFAKSAYGLPPLGNNAEWCTDETKSIGGMNSQVQMFYHIHSQFNRELYLRAEEVCLSFIDEAVSAISSLNYKIVGCTAMMEQTNCSVALLSGVKKQSPETITIIGGGNCEGEMAEGVASLSESIDYVFSGESETAFLNFLGDHSTGKLPSQGILKGEPLADLDSLSVPDYTAFFEQSAYFFENENKTDEQRIWYETSRGCWWAEKKKCTFCGIYPVSFRSKSPGKTLGDLKSIAHTYPGSVIFMTDNMMPQSYHHEFLPSLAEQGKFPTLAYQVKANLDFQDLVNLKDANIKSILPGIESLSTNLLKLMDKGVSARQNLLLLRNAMSLGIYCEWFMPWGFPGDRVSDYEEMLNIFPLIRHLQPPRRFTPMTLVRFSAYYNNRERYGIKNIHPWGVFEMIYPEWANLEKLASYYTGDYASEAYEHPQIIRDLADEISEWKKVWKNSILSMKFFMNNYVIYDNRDIHEKEKTHL
ncbi:MAG: RiPP maturation radical SAM protein 1, partial [bacterium]|nr:RiPP maturation radical SAM protein 1 [bacterium]